MFDGSLFFALGLGFLAGAAVKLALGSRLRIGWAGATLSGVVGAGIGGAIASAVVRVEGVVDMRVLLAGIGGMLVTTALVALVAQWLHRRAVAGEDTPEPPSVRELIAAGESDRVEFKASARFNRHTGTRDDRLELVIAKTVAGFLNADGGTLLIGVADDGSVVGVESDYTLMKQPDRDRYELWLRDLLATCLGTPAAGLVDVSFAEVEGCDVCKLDVPPSPAPVFLDTPKGPRHADFYVRVGNSTRQLLTDEVLEYHDRHWA